MQVTNLKPKTQPGLSWSRGPCASIRGIPTRSKVRATLVTAFRQNRNPAQAELYDLPREPPPCAVARQALLAGVEGGVCAPAGYSAQGVYAGLREVGCRADLALLLSDREAVVAAGTPSPSTNGARPSRVRVGYRPTAQAVLITAGREESEAGEDSVHSSSEVAAAVAALLSIPADRVLLVSIGTTGGAQKRTVLSAAAELVTNLDSGAEGAHHASCALATDADTVCKNASAEVQLRNGRTVRLGGIAHGDSQGVQAIISCDAPVEAQLWRSMHARAVAASFNQLAMPGSGTAPPTDAVIAMANGAAGGTLIADPDSDDAARLEEGLTALMQGLAKEVAWDAEGAHCLLEVGVVGAPSAEAANTVALAVAQCAVVRGSIAACQPDAAAVAEAASRPGVDFPHGNLRVILGGMPILVDGSTPSSFSLDYISTYLHDRISRGSQVRLQVELGAGHAKGLAWSSGAGPRPAAAAVEEKSALDEEAELEAALTELCC